MQLSPLFNQPVDKDTLINKEWLCPASFQCDANHRHSCLISHKLASPCQVNYPGIYGFFLSSISSACSPASRCNSFHLHKDSEHVLILSKNHFDCSQTPPLQTTTIKALRTTANHHHPHTFELLIITTLAHPSKLLCINLSLVAELR